MGASKAQSHSRQPRLRQYQSHCPDMLLMSPPRRHLSDTHETTPDLQLVNTVDGRTDCCLIQSLTDHTGCLLDSSKSWHASRLTSYPQVRSLTFMWRPSVLTPWTKSKPIPRATWRRPPCQPQTRASCRSIPVAACRYKSNPSARDINPDAAAVAHTGRVVL